MNSINTLRIQISFFFIVIFGGICFSQSTYLTKDFLYQEEVYLLTASREGGVHVFTVALDADKQKFVLAGLGEQYLFYKKLAVALGKVKSASERNYLQQSQRLNDTLSLLQKEMSQDASWSFSPERQEKLSQFIRDLASIKGCDSVFHNRALMTAMLSNTINDNALDYFTNLKENCNLFAGNSGEAESQELLEISMNLFAAVLKNSLIEPNEASLAGRIVVFGHEVVVCEEQDRNKNNKQDNSSTTNNENPVPGLNDSSGNNGGNNSSRPSSDYPELDSDLENEINEQSREFRRVFGDSSQCKNSIPDTFKIDSIQLEFEADKLQNIKVIGRLNHLPEIFENNFPMSFSTKEAVNANFELHSVLNLDGKRRHLSRRNFIYYDYNLLLYTENYAPKDQTVYIKPGEDGVILFKEKSSEILKTKVFTDLVGLNENAPNGLLQLEFSKPIYLNSTVHHIGGEFNRDYIYFLNQIEPVFIFNKIEEDSNVLEAISLEGSAFVSYGDILRYRKASIGFDLTGLTFGFPRIHSIFSLKYNHHYSIIPVGVVDSVQSVGNEVNNHLTRELGPSLEWRILPSDKYELSITYALNFLKFYSNDRDDKIIPFENKNTLIITPSEIAQNNTDKSKMYHTFQLLATIRLSKRGELFFRSRYHFVHKNPNQNFFQSQLGYSYFFFSNN